MVVLPFRFEHCPRCGRLITVDAINILGLCTKECGGSITSPAPRTPYLDRMSAAHYCPDPDQCAFGHVGCRDSDGREVTR